MTTESVVIPEARRGIHRRPQLDAERRKAFASARNHSRVVRFLKFALPASAVVLVAAFGVHSWLSAPTIAVAQVRQTNITSGKLVMSAPKLEGFTKNNLAYTLSAARAVQNVKKVGVFELEGIEAKLPVNADTWAEVKADRGIYDRDNNTIDFQSEVSVTTTDGMSATFSKAFYDIGKGELKTVEPVAIKLSGTDISADGMTVLDNGKVLIFENRVRMEISPDQLKSKERSADENGG